MNRGRRAVWRTVLLLAAPILIVVLHGGVWASDDSPALSTPDLALAWDAEGSTPDVWLVRAGADDSWVSVVTRAAEGDRITKHLRLEGLGVEAGIWRHIDEGASVVAMEKLSEDGRLRVRQRIAPAEEDYRLQYRLQIENLSSEVFDPGDDNLRLWIGPGLGEYPVDGFGIAQSLYSFVQPLVYVDGDMESVESPAGGGTLQVPLEDPAGIEWAGLHSRYFALLVAGLDSTAIGDVAVSVPEDDTVAGLPKRYLTAVGLTIPLRPIASGDVLTREFLVYSGPKAGASLASGGKDFSGVLFGGLWDWMRLLCIGLLWILGMIYAVVPNWGVAIILLAVLVRVILYPVAKRALASQKAFADVQKTVGPELARIKQQYRGEEQSERILELYKSHGVSPLAGLKPLFIVLVQVPIFIALFHVLGQAYELREASFLWMDTLAEPDQLLPFGFDVPFFGAYFNVLPVLLAITTLMTIKFSPAPAADAAGRRRQNVFLVFMAIGFLLIFYPFPAGMVLYWTVANLLHLAQQYVVER